MTFWIMLWKTVFIVTIVIFMVMAVLVTWFGAADIRRLLQRLQEGDDSTEQERIPPGD